MVSREDLDFVVTSSDAESSQQVNITCIAIKNSSGTLFKEYSNYDIWISYRYKANTDIRAVIDFQISSNYTLDKEYIQAFKTLAQNVGLSVVISLSILHI